MRTGTIAWDAVEIRLDVVYWHGRFRSLNNPHLAMLSGFRASKGRTLRRVMDRYRPCMLESAHNCV